MISLKSEWDRLSRLKASDPEMFEKGCQKLISADSELLDENLQIVEEAILALGALYSKNCNAQGIKELIVGNALIFKALPKAKIAKIVKNLIDFVAKIPNTIDLQISLCAHLIDWCTAEKRNYLKHRIEIRLAGLYYQAEKHVEGLKIIEPLLKDIRKADDKHLLVEIQLLESKIHHSLQNLAKAKASLTAARACANSIYCPPQLQADIDLMSGILNAQDKDFKTAYSYFYESFEAFNSMEDARAILPLKYMILSKIMTDSADDVYAILSGKYGLKYMGESLQAMKEITDAHSEKSLKKFQAALERHLAEINNDPIIKHHVQSLYEHLLEQNLFRVIEPYSKVQIEYIAQQVNLKTEIVQEKLSEMILDKKFDGTLDQGSGALIIFDDLKCDKLYGNAGDTIGNMNVVVDKLFEKTKKLKQQN